jgi:hypothetical protein
MCNWLGGFLDGFAGVYTDPFLTMYSAHYRKGWACGHTVGSWRIWP